MVFLPKASEYMMPAVLVEDEAVTTTLLLSPIPFIPALTLGNLCPTHRWRPINMFIAYVHFFLCSVNCLTLFP